MRDGVTRVAFVAGDLVRGDERGYDLAQPAHRAAMRFEVRRVGLAVATDVRASAGVRRIGPPVVALRIEIMRAARAPLGANSGDRYRLLVQVAVGLLEDAMALEGDEVLARNLSAEWLGQDNGRAQNSIEHHYYGT